MRVQISTQVSHVSAEVKGNSRWFRLLGTECCATLNDCRCILPWGEGWWGRGRVVMHKWDICWNLPYSLKDWYHSWIITEALTHPCRMCTEPSIRHHFPPINIPGLLTRQPICQRTLSSHILGCQWGVWTAPAPSQPPWEGADHGPMSTHWPGCPLLPTNQWTKHCWYTVASANVGKSPI